MLYALCTRHYALCTVNYTLGNAKHYVEWYIEVSMECLIIWRSVDNDNSDDNYDNNDDDDDVSQYWPLLLGRWSASSMFSHTQADNVAAEIQSTASAWSASVEKWDIAHKGYFPGCVKDIARSDRKKMLQEFGKVSGPRAGRNLYQSGRGTW